MNTIKWIRELFSPPPALVVAARELEEHRRQLLNAQSSREYANSMCIYHEAAISRLTNYLREEP